MPHILTIRSTSESAAFPSTVGIKADSNRSAIGGYDGTSEKKDSRIKAEEEKNMINSRFFLIAKKNKKSRD
jgi:hypothetical protein